MKIEKVFNNNTVATLSKDKVEMIVTGPGIGFQKKIGDELDERKVEKRYLIEDSQKGRFYQMLEKVPVEYFEISEIIFKRAWKEFKGGLSSQMVLMLTDHIAFALQRQKDHIQVPNLLLSDIRTLYHKEYQIGVWALKYIALRTGVSLPYDEAGFIAMHIINAKSADGGKTATDIMNFSKQIIDLIEKTMKLDVHEDNLDYSRLMTHLKYLGQRIFSKKKEELKMEDNPQMYEMMLGMNPNLSVCLERIEAFVKRNYDYCLDKQELFYIMIHIVRIKK